MVADRVRRLALGRVTLREPLEEGHITISHAKSSVTFPPRFQFIAATNPCNCGMHGSKLKQCKCSPQQIEKYLAKISGPLLDRIAIHVHVQPVDVGMWGSSSQRMTSVEMRDMVQRAREMQVRRFAGMNGIDCNARLPEAMFAQHCRMGAAAEALFMSAQKASLVSARARAHIIRVSRTIADLTGSETLVDRHVGEALQYRGRG